MSLRCVLNASLLTQVLFSFPEVRHLLPRLLGKAGALDNNHRINASGYYGSLVDYADSHWTASTFNGEVEIRRLPGKPETGFCI
jgi:hypothetical protein